MFLRESDTKLVDRDHGNANYGVLIGSYALIDHSSAASCKPRQSWDESLARRFKLSEESTARLKAHGLPVSSRAVHIYVIANVILG